MDSDLPLPTQENDEPKAEFRKLTNEATYRKYRRHSPDSGSSDEDGSPKHDHISRGSAKASNHARKSQDNVDDRSSNRSQHGRNSDSYKHTSRGSRHDDHSRYGKHADEIDRSYAKASDRSGRESRGGSNSDFRDRETNYSRPRDHKRDVDKYPRDKSDRTRYDGRHGSRYDDRDRHFRDRDHHQDERREYRSPRDCRGDRTTSYDSHAKKETGSMKDLDSSKNKQEKSKLEGLDRPDDRHGRAGGRSDDRSAFVSEDFASKRPKFSLGSDTSQDCEDLAAKVPAQQGAISGADSVTSVDAAKVAAIRAAQLVNQNLTSTGFMNADQKKKLLWGSKKSNVTEESSHRWDSALFSDRERQEKFNKLMSLRLPWYIWPIVGCEGRSEGGPETSEQSRRREAERTSAGSRETIHCWAPTKRWPHCRVRSVKLYLTRFLTVDALV